MSWKRKPRVPSHRRARPGVRYRIATAGTNSAGHPAGTFCYDFLGDDGGAAAADGAETSVAHKAMTLDAKGRGEFFTVPINELIEVGYA